MVLILSLVLSHQVGAVLALIHRLMEHRVALVAVVDAPQTLEAQEHQGRDSLGEMLVVYLVVVVVAAALSALLDLVIMVALVEMESRHQ